MASLATIIGPKAGISPTFLSNVNAAADAAGIPVIQITPHGGKRSDPAHPGGVNNASVGGVPHSNHLTGNAIDAWAIWPNGKKVPLATALGGIHAPDYGLRLGTSFDYQGKPDVFHVDDAANQGTTLVAKHTSNVPAPLFSAINSAAAKYGIDPSVLVGIWKIESGSSFPNPYVNSSGYGGLFGTTKWNAPTIAQANYAAATLANLIRTKGSLPAALSAYSGGAYSSVDGSGSVSPSGSAASTPASQASLPTPPVRPAVGGDTAFTIYNPTPPAPVTYPRTTDPFGGEPVPTSLLPKNGNTSVASPFDLSSILKQFGVPTVNSINQQASQYAKSDIASQVAGYLALMKYTTGVGRQRGLDDMAAARAAAGILSPLVAQTGAGYDQAIQATAGLAGGYGGGLGNLVGAQTDQANQILASAGSPRTLQNAGPALAGAVRGLSGAIPAAMLGFGGDAARALAATYPAQALATGSAGRTAAIGAANEQAQQYAAQIVGARAQLPQLTRQYMSSLGSQRSSALSSALQLLNLGKPIIHTDSFGRTIALNPFTGASQVLDQGSGKFISSRYGIVQVNPDGSITPRVTYPSTGAGAPKLSTAASGAYGYMVDTTGNPILDKNGKPIPYPQGGSSAASSRLNTTASAALGYMVDNNGDPIRSTKGTTIPYPKTPVKNPTLNTTASEAFGFMVDSNGAAITNTKGQRIPYPKKGVTTTAGNLNTTASKAYGVQVNNSGQVILNPKTKKPIPYPQGKGVGGGYTAGEAQSSVNKSTTRAHGSASVQVATGTQAGHGPDPFDVALKYATETRPKITPAWRKRVLGIVMNAYAPVVKNFATFLHQGPNTTDQTARNYGAWLQGTTGYVDPQTGQADAGSAAVILLNMGYPAELVVPAITAEYGVSEGHLAALVERVQTIHTNQQVTTPPASGGGGGGNNWIWPGGNRFWPGGKFWWPGI